MRGESRGVGSGTRQAMNGGALAAYVFLSSFLGLDGRVFLGFGNLNGAWGFFVAIWQASAIADGIFLVGTAVAGVVAYRLAARWGLLAGAGVALLLNWLVYTISFMALPGAGYGRADGFLDSASFVGSWGVVGLVFATLAPPVFAKVRMAASAPGPVAASV